MSIEQKVKLVICACHKECPEDCSHSRPHPEDWGCNLPCTHRKEGHCKCIPYVVPDWDAVDNTQGESNG